MFFNSHSKKTFGVENKVYLKFAANFYSSVYTVLIVLFIGEAIAFLAIHGRPYACNAFRITIAHFAGSMIILYFSRFIFRNISRKRTLLIGCVTIFHYIYLFNPWITKYQKRAEDFYTTFPYTIKLHSIVFYCCLDLWYLAGMFYLTSSALLYFSYACEIFILIKNHFPNLTPKNPVSFYVPLAHLVFSISIIVFTGISVFFDEENKVTRKQSIRLGCMTFFNILFTFNPWIAKYNEDAKLFHKVLHYTVPLYYILFGCCLVLSAFMCWLPWKGQVKNQFHEARAKMVHFIYSFNPIAKCQNEAADLYSKWKNYLKREKKRPRYKVIYGGEDSATKKMIKLN